MDLKKLSPANWFKNEQEEKSISSQTASYNPVTQMHQEMDRIFDQAFRGFGFPTSRLLSQRWPELGSDLAQVLRPNLDIKEGDDHFIVSVEMPGVEKSDVNIELNGHDLIISGEKKQEETKENEGYHCVERSYGSFRRLLHLPESADPETLKASFENGVLSLNVSKRIGEQNTGRKIELE